MTDKKAQPNAEESRKGKAQNKLDKFDARGIQTLFRTLSRNHYNLLKMIDAKASIILTVNSIIISLLMGVIFMAEADQKHILQIGSTILLNCGLASMVFALIAMLPHRYPSKKKRQANYRGSLYGNNFSKFTIEEYKAEMQRIISTGTSIYDEMIMDLYYLGKTISIKQKMILISVAFFLIGLIGSLLHSFSHGIMIDKIFFSG